MVGRTADEARVFASGMDARGRREGEAGLRLFRQPERLQAVAARTSGAGRAHKSRLSEPAGQPRADGRVTGLAAWARGHPRADSAVGKGRVTRLASADSIVGAGTGT